MFVKVWRKVGMAFFSAGIFFTLNFFLVSEIIKRLDKSLKIEIWRDYIFLQPVANQFWIFSLPLEPKLIYLITFTVLIFLSGIYLKHFKTNSLVFSFGFGLILAGAIANFYARWSQGFVWDYFNISFFLATGSWNFADLLVIAGVIIWIKEFSSPKVTI